MTLYVNKNDPLRQIACSLFLFAAPAYVDTLRDTLRENAGPLR